MRVGSASRPRNETFGALALVSVVSRVLIGALQIFIKFGVKRRDC